MLAKLDNRRELFIFLIAFGTFFETLLCSVTFPSLLYIES